MSRDTKQYYIANAIREEIDSKNMFLYFAVITNMAGNLSNAGYNIISPILIVKKQGIYQSIISILEKTPKIKLIDITYNYTKEEKYSYDELTIKELTEIVLRKNDELIEIKGNQIRIFTNDE